VLFKHSNIFSIQTFFQKKFYKEGKHCFHPTLLHWSSMIDTISGGGGGGGG
jgi:hypothetical protein